MLRRLKIETDYDFTSQDPAVMLEFSNDALATVEACYSLYGQQLKDLKVSEAEFEELCGPEEVELLRAEVTQQMRSFSTFWKMVSTEMEAVQSGDTSLVELAERAEAVRRTKETSGPST